VSERMWGRAVSSETPAAFAIDRIERFGSACRRRSILARYAAGRAGRPSFFPCARARASPVFVRSLIRCASTFASDAVTAKGKLRTSSLSVARYSSV
jgi:hypothetical protein